jgi:PadR family transcriptional regulator, regulatory protein PadR
MDVSRQNPRSFLVLAGFSFLLTIERSKSILSLGYLEERGAMTEKPAGLVQGTLDMLILKTLALEPMHGWGIAQRIEQISQGVFQVNPGSLFPAFRRLERSGLVKSEWRATENNRRAKYYMLSDQGRKQLKSETREWGKQIAAIARILETS